MRSGAYLASRMIVWGFVLGSTAQTRRDVREVAAACARVRECLLKAMEGRARASWTIGIVVGLVIASTPVAASLWDHLSWVPFVLVGVGMIIWRKRLVSPPRQELDDGGEDGFHGLLQELQSRWHLGEKYIIVFALFWLAVSLYELVHG
jgi:hypothetical protein